MLTSVSRGQRRVTCFLSTSALVEVCVTLTQSRHRIANVGPGTHTAYSPGLFGLPSSSVVPELDARLLRPRHGRPITATTRIHPLAGQGVAVVAEGAFGVRRGALLPSPDREGIPFQFVDVVEGVAHVVVEARLDLLTRLGPEETFVADDL